MYSSWSSAKSCSASAKSEVEMFMVDEDADDGVAVDMGILVVCRDQKKTQTDVLMNE
jgi:hypothetical protein